MFRKIQTISPVLHSLAEQVNGYGMPRIIPIGNARAFLKALEISIGFAAFDLRESLWANRYACSIADLEEINHRLSFYNQGYGEYLDDVEAVNDSYWRASEALNNIAGRPSCYRRPWN